MHQAQVWVILALTVGVPWLTWWTLTTPNPHAAVTETPILLSALGLLLVLSIGIGATDAWLGVFVGYLVLRTLPLTSPFAFETAYLSVLGAMALTMVSKVPPAMIARLKGMLLAGGAVQAGYGIVQALGYDPIWIGWYQAVDPSLDIRGTLGNRDFFGAYQAILLCLSPVWLMPVFLIGLGLSKCVVAMLSACLGLSWRYRQYRVTWGIACVGILACAGYAMMRTPELSSLWHRFAVWTMALTDWMAHPILGWGTGAWPLRIPQLQQIHNIYPESVFVQAHHEYLQILYDGGVIGLGLLAGWIWTHRRMCCGTMGGSVMAIAVNSLGNFPFHVGTTALLSLMVMGLACAEERGTYVEA